MIAKSFAGIQLHNLVNPGVLALTFENGADHARIVVDDVLSVHGLGDAVRRESEVIVRLAGEDREIRARHRMTLHQLDIFLAGGVVNYLRGKRGLEYGRQSRAAIPRSPKHQA